MLLAIPLLIIPFALYNLAMTGLFGDGGVAVLDSEVMAVNMLSGTTWTMAFGETPLVKNLQMPIQLVEEQVRRNTEMFQQAMKMFSPFANAAPQPKETRKAEPKDLDELKEQLRALQTKLDKLS